MVSEFNYPTHLTMRLSPREWELLRTRALGMSYSAYIRACAFGDEIKLEATRGKKPVKDHVALGKVLALQGASGFGQNFHKLANAAESGSLKMSDEVRIAVLQACADNRQILSLLLKALGKNQKH